MTQREKMLAGKLYDPGDRELAELRRQAHALSKQYNDTLEDETEQREAILDRLLPNRGECAFLQGPVYFDYGAFTRVGKYFYANFNLTVLDCCPVEIGDNVLIGPNVSLVTPVHPLRWQDRNIRVREDGSLEELEYAKPIFIEDNCWLGANVTVLGGVRIGEGSVIGAGSVVARDIPPHSLAVGNPCRVVRSITEADALFRKPELY